MFINGTSASAATVMLCNDQSQNLSGLHQWAVIADTSGVSWWSPGQFWLLWLGFSNFWGLAGLGWPCQSRAGWLSSAPAVVVPSAGWPGRVLMAMAEMRVSTQRHVRPPEAMPRTGMRSGLHSLGHSKPWDRPGLTEWGHWACTFSETNCRVTQ